MLSRFCAPVKNFGRAEQVSEHLAADLYAISGFDPTFPKENRHSPSGLPFAHQFCLELPADQVFCVPKGVSGREDARSWADQAANVCNPGPLVKLFSAADRPVEALSFSLVMDRGHAHDGGSRNRRMAARMARTIGPVTAKSC